MKYFLLAATPAVFLGLLNFLPNYGVPLPPPGGIGVVLFLTILAYSAVRHRIMDIDVVLIRSSSVVVALLVVALPLVLVAIWFDQSTSGHTVASVAMATTGLLIVGMLAYSSVRQRLEFEIHRSLFPARRRARKSLESFSSAIVQLTHRHRLAEELAATLTDGLGLVGAALYLSATGGRGLHRAAVAGTLEAPMELNEAVLAGEGQQVSGFELLVPISPMGTTHGVLACLALGPKRSLAAIDEVDKTLLALLASQVGIALKNLEHVREIEAQREAIRRQKAEIEELKRRVEAENVVLRAEVSRHSAFGEIIGSSAALQQALGLVERAARSAVSILITGETGTGKELIARAIHDLSARRDGPLISVNCSAIPQELAEAELFGCERGAFTGATESRPGRFEMADGGTIFLDEIADLPMAIQTKLLRVLQEREVQRLGGRRATKLDVRVVAASNRDLRAAIGRGEFREDLYHRVAAIVAELPPLRERAGDIDVLATYFLERAATTYQKTIVGFTAGALSALRSYNWPGNIRELQNVVERAVLLCEEQVISAPHLGDLAGAEVSERSQLTMSMREEKARRIQQALTDARGNQAEAARRLGISRSNLARMMKNLGLKSQRTLQ